MVFVNHKFTRLVEKGIFAGRVFGFPLLQVRGTATTSQALSAHRDKISAFCHTGLGQAHVSQVLGQGPNMAACWEEQGTKHCGGVLCCLVSPVIHKDAFS